MNWPAQSHYNRLAWLSLVEPLFLIAAGEACAKALRFAAEGAPLAGKYQPRSAGACSSALPDGNHGEIFAKVQSV